MVLLSEKEKKRVVEKKAVRKKGSKKSAKKGRKKGRKGKNDVPPNFIHVFSNFYPDWTTEKKSAHD